MAGIASETVTAAGVRYISVSGLAQLKAFSHASISDGTIYVSGGIGTKPGTMELVDGGLGEETTQVLRNIEMILVACGASMAHLTKVNVYLHAYSPERFAEMNAAYLTFFADAPVPPRITVGCTGLALGAQVEMDATAKAP